MSGDNQLEQLVKELSAQITELRKKIETLEDKANRLSVSKASNGKYPYYEFILSYGLTPDHIEQVNRLFMAISEKLEGNNIPVGLKNSKFPTDFLFTSEPIEYNDVKNAIQGIWPISDKEICAELIQAMKNQGIQINACKYLLSQL